MDSLTGFAKGGVQKGGATQSTKVEPSSALSGVLKKDDKDALRTFIAGAMPMGELRSLWDSASIGMVERSGAERENVETALLRSSIWFV